MSPNLRHVSAALLLILSTTFTFALLSVTDTVAAGTLVQGEDPTPTPPPQNDGSAWSEPVNLSNSAIADNPHLVLPTQSNTLSGTTVLWQETGVPGMVYAGHDGRQWSSPLSTELPFATGAYYPDLSPEETPPIFSPILLHDETNQIVHALWTDENNILWHSQIAVEAAGDTFQAVQENGFDAWSQRVQLAENAVGVNAELGPGPAAASDEALTTVHISYVRQLSTEEEPAGVYYMQFDDDAGPSNTTTTLLYPTRYAMALAPSNARTQLVLHPTAAPTTNVLVSWELSPLQKIFLTRSTDGGETWDDATVLDQRAPDDPPGATAPTNIHLASDGESIFALWQAGHHDAPCTQYYNWSEDGGQTWQGPQPMLQSFLFCPSQLEMLTFPGAAPLLFTVIDGRPYLQAWAAQSDSPTDAVVPVGSWSEPQPQDGLASFTNPDTFQPVTLSCLQAGRPQADTVIVVGCQQDDSKDIWTLQRAVEDLNDWFAASPWRVPVSVFDQSQQTNGLQLLTTTGQAEGSAAHAFWNEPAQQAIYYARLDGADCTAVSDNCSWTRPLVLVSPSQGPTGSPAVAIAPDAASLTEDVLLLTWHSNDGAIYFSRASSNQALTAADWSTPQVLPAPPGAYAVQPAIAHIDGTILVAYTVPFNEQRGLYLTTSQDMGATWSPPSTILDGAAAGWHVVGGPRLALGSDTGQMHFLVAQQTMGVQGAIQTRALHYIRSQAEASNGESSFTTPHQLFDGPVSWYQLHLQPGQSENVTTVHAMWQEAADGASSELLSATSGDTAALWSQRSFDSGQTWELGQRILVPPGASASVGLQQAIHLLHATPDTLRHWYWDGTSWQESARLRWPDSPTTAAYLPATLGATLSASASAEERSPSEEGDPSSEGLDTADLLILYDPPGQDAGQGPRFTLRHNAHLHSGSLAADGTEAQSVFADATPATPSTTGATPLAAPANTESAAATPTAGAGVAQSSAAQDGSEETPGAANVVQAIRQTTADPLALILFAIIPAALLVLTAGLVKLGLSRRRRG